MNWLLPRFSLVALVIVAVVSAAAFWLAYQNYPNHPDLTLAKPSGWYRSEDQHYYLVIAQELATKRLKTYHFGLGYPILGAWLGLGICRQIYRRYLVPAFNNLVVINSNWFS